MFREAGSRPGARWAVMMAGLALVSSACGPIRMNLAPAPSSCRAPIDGLTPQWWEPSDDRDRAEIALWCKAIGPVAHYEPPSAAPAQSQRPIVVASWNTGVGRGHIVDFINGLLHDHSGADVIVLMQEAYRSGGVPEDCPADSRRTKRITSENRGEEFLSAAKDAKMYGVYVPSMRNGLDCAEPPREDRGNAIFSTLPLSEVVAIELPFGQQRRVAIAATVHMGAKALRVVSLHFDTYKRHQSQAQGVIEVLKALPPLDGLIVAGDFNGVSLDPGVRALRKQFTEAYCGDVPTHDVPALRIDHLFTSGFAVPVPCTTSDASHGSDHWAVIALPLLSK